MTDADRIMALIDENYICDQHGGGLKVRTAIEQALSARVPPLGTMTVNENMGAAFVFNEPFTLLPGQMFYLYAASQPPAQEVQASEGYGVLISKLANVRTIASSRLPRQDLETIDEAVRVLAMLNAAPQPPAREAAKQHSARLGGSMMMALAVIRELTGTQQKDLEATIDAVRSLASAPQPPAQREWVGLTDEEMADALPDGFQLLGEPRNFSGITLTRMQLRVFANNYVAKLREKNGGGV